LTEDEAEVWRKRAEDAMNELSDRGERDFEELWKTATRR
jgi:hypothetical protein